MPKEKAFSRRGAEAQRLGFPQNQYLKTAALADAVDEERNASAPLREKLLVFLYSGDRALELQPSGKLVRSAL